MDQCSFIVQSKDGDSEDEGSVITCPPSMVGELLEDKPDLVPYDDTEDSNLNNTGVDKNSITLTRKFLQQQPVLVDGFLFDMDADSERYMVRTLEYWDVSKYPTIVWTLADNTEAEVTKDQLADLWDRACRMQFERGVALHYRSRELKVIASSLKRSDISINSVLWDTSIPIEELI